jgi:hypothetical protein
VEAWVLGGVVTRRRVARVVPCQRCAARKVVRCRRGISIFEVLSSAGLELGDERSIPRYAWGERCTRKDRHGEVRYGSGSAWDRRR